MNEFNDIQGFIPLNWDDNRFADVNMFGTSYQKILIRLEHTTDIIILLKINVQAQF